ncbi:MAG: zf-HC2 domain-containing protein [Acidimicrobiales bacterium]
MNGPHLGDALSALADGELAAAELAEAQLHLSACSGCTDELAATSWARALVRDLATLDPPAPLTVVTPRGAVSGRRWAAPAAAAVAAVALGLLATVGGGAARPQPTPMAQLVQVHAASAANGDPLSQLAPSAIPVSFRGP